MRNEETTMQLNRWPNLVAMFFEQADFKGDSAFLWKKRDGEWQSVSWTEAAQQIQLLAVDALRRFEDFGYKLNP